MLSIISLIASSALFVPSIKAPNASSKPVCIFSARLPKDLLILSAVVAALSPNRSKKDTRGLSPSAKLPCFNCLSIIP